jgi:hypothetical protein
VGLNGHLTSIAIWGIAPALAAELSTRRSAVEPLGSAQRLTPDGVVEQITERTSVGWQTKQIRHAGLIATERCQLVLPNQPAT